MNNLADEGSFLYELFHPGDRHPENEEDDTVRRRRRCMRCDKRSPHTSASISRCQIIKRNGQPYRIRSQQAAGEHETGSAQAPGNGRERRAAITRIESACFPWANVNCRPSSSGEQVMRELRKLDKVGYIRYASVYRNFEDVDEFRSDPRDLPGREQVASKT